MINTEQAEVLNPHQQALLLTQDILRDPAKLEALRSGVGRYTNSIEVEFAGLDSILNATDSKVFSKERGAGYMLWSTLVDRLQRGGMVKPEDLTAEKLQDLIYQSYSNSGASSTY